MSRQRDYNYHEYHVTSKVISNKKADVNVVCSSYVHQQDFNVPGLSWYSSVIWRHDFFGPIEFKPADLGVRV
jgi:hypothetical protein